MIKLNLNQLGAEAHFKIVKPMIQKRTRKILNSGIKRGGVDIVLLDPFRGFLNSLLNDTIIENLILLKPNSFNGVIAQFTDLYPSFFVSGSVENYVLRNIFIAHCYDNDDFCKLTLIKRVSIDTCPYCNRNYIYYLSKKHIIKPQIDHFYPKSKYPFLGMSFYNLIPSCQTCNGFGAKGEKDPIEHDLINPYLILKEQFKFTYKVKNVNFLNPVFDKNSIEIKFEHQLSGHSSIFKIDKLYEQHADHVLELILKSKIQYSEGYREYLRKEYPDLNIKSHEIDRLIVGNYTLDEELHKRPLAKLYQDISRKLGLIE